jgi:predicted RNase H-like HicB family nuclease
VTSDFTLRNIKGKDALRENMEYTILIHKTEEGGFWAEVPALPGCFSQGESIEKTIANTKEAIELHISCLEEDGEEIPADNEFIISRVHVETFAV